MTTEQPVSPPAGWHPDPVDPNQSRYWDGTAWTEQVRPITPPAPPSATPTPAGDAPPLPKPGTRVPAGAAVPPPSMRPGKAPVHPAAEVGFFRSLFDLSFAPDRVVTISFARVLYLLAGIVSVIVWLVGALILFSLGENDSGFTGWAIAHLMLGWVGVLLTVVGVRVLLEVMIAQIRTSQHTAKIAQQTRTPRGF